MLKSTVAKFIVGFVAASVFAGAHAQAATAENRVALVIGNSNYKNSPLVNPANDARTIAKALRQAGFLVILKTDATRREMRRAMIDFGKRLEQGGVGLFYYAGHGVQIDGNNYLIPVNAEIEAEEHVAIESVELNQILGRMGGARNQLNIVILDACRNNPFARSFRSASRGLAQTLAPAGSYIAYATAPGDVASDGDGKNSPYTRALSKWIGKPGVRLEDVFKGVRRDISRDTGGRQVPWTSSSITGDFYFTPAKQTVTAALSPPGGQTTAQPAVTRVSPNVVEVTYWDTIKFSENPADFEAYLKKFPKGVFADLARIRIGELKSPKSQKVQTETRNTQVAKAAPEPKRTKTRSARSRESDYAGQWIAEDGPWKVEIEIKGFRILGKAYCSKRERPPSGTINNDGSVGPAKIDARLRGKINRRHTTRIWTRDENVNYRELKGTFPELKMWNAGECGGAKLTFRRKDEAPTAAN